MIVGTGIGYLTTVYNGITLYYTIFIILGSLTTWFITFYTYTILYSNNTTGFYIYTYLCIIDYTVCIIGYLIYYFYIFTF